MADNQLSNETQNNYAQCKVVVYPWVIQLNDPDAPNDELAATTRLDISSQVTQVTFSKNLGEPAGSFNISLTNSPGFGTNDWKDILKRGYWLVIYMSQDGDLSMSQSVGEATHKASERSKIRGICYIERCGTTGNTGEKGDVDRHFQVSGKDFGIIYEKTEIWHNMFKFDRIMLDSLRTSELNVVSNVKLDRALTLIHNLIYFPSNEQGAKPNDDNSLLDIGLQWLMPRRMLSDIGFNVSGLTQGTFWGALGDKVLNFDETTCGIAIESPTEFLSGNAWDQLKKLSVPHFHELFCETTDSGLPQLTFRPIPWGIDNSGYPKAAASITLYKDLDPIVYVPAINLINDDLAEEDHARYNSFLATVSTGLINVEDNISLLDGSGFPFHNRASIRRHGFRPMHVDVDSIVRNEDLANGAANREALIEFNEILYDYWNNAIFAESGTITVIGSNDLKIGKVLKFTGDVPYSNTKRYYIEGYTDTFTVGAKGEAIWTQSIVLTRGFEEQDLKNKGGFLNRNTPFTAPGEFTSSNNGND
jgi:hypothetical protein